MFWLLYGSQSLQLSESMMEGKELRGTESSRAWTFLLFFCSSSWTSCLLPSSRPELERMIWCRKALTLTATLTKESISQQEAVKAISWHFRFDETMGVNGDFV